MKVLLVATVQSHICQFHKPLAKVLHEAGAEIHVAARNNLAEKNGLALDFVEQVFDLPFSRSPKSTYNLRAYKQLKEIIERECYDVIHCNTPMGGIVARLAAKKARKRGTKIFYTAHGFHFYKGASKKSWLVFYPIEKFFAKHYTDKLITIVKEDYELAKEKFKTEVCTIHGVGVNAEKYTSVTAEENQAFRTEQGYEDRFVILCTGELNKNKNQSLIIRAMPEVIKTDPKALLLLAGNGPEEQNLRSLIADLQLDDHVRLLGYRTDLERYLNACDLVCSASIREGLGLNIIEAMLCEKAVVASDNRGHRELVENHKTGWILPESTEKAMAAAIIDLMTHSDQRQSFGAVARERVEPYLSCHVEKELKEIYGV